MNKTSLQLIKQNSIIPKEKLFKRNKKIYPNQNSRMKNSSNQFKNCGISMNQFKNQFFKNHPTQTVRVSYPFSFFLYFFINLPWYAGSKANSIIFFLFFKFSCCELKLRWNRRQTLNWKENNPNLQVWLWYQMIRTRTWYVQTPR